MIRFRLVHRTRYVYSARVDFAQHLLHLDARPDAGQRVDRTEIFCDPAPARHAAGSDHFGNRIAHLVLAAPHDRLELTLRAEGEVFPRVVPSPEAGPPWETVVAQLAANGFPTEWAASEFVHKSPLAMHDPQIQNFAGPSFPPGRPVLACARDLAGRIHRGFRYDPAATDVSTPLGRVLAMRAGVCQDFAHLAIAALRGTGLAARYVSGYIATRPAPGASRLRGADASHAWISVWCGADLGWVEIDPTNDCVVRDEHVVAAWGRDYSDVSPVRGVLVGGGAHRVEVAVDLELGAAVAKMRGDG